MHALEIASRNIHSPAYVKRTDKAMRKRMSDEQLSIDKLKAKWSDEDFQRHNLQKEARKRFLESEADQTFAPLQDYLTRLGKALRAAGGSMEISPEWEHLNDYKLRRVVRIFSSDPAEEFLVDLTIQGVSIFYHDKPYRFSIGIRSLIDAITSDVEQFLTPHRTGPS
jgi:hypothetical protein